MLSSPPALPASARKHSAASAGLFVGLRDFTDPEWHPVLFGVDDAIDLAHLFVLELGLVVPEKTVLLLSGESSNKESKTHLEELKRLGVAFGYPSVAAVYQQASRLGQLTEQDGLIVTTFSTHGVTDQGKGVLAGAETLVRRPVSTGLIIDVVIDELMRAKALRRLVLLDTCRERIDQTTRALSEAEGPLSDPFVEAMKQAKGCAILMGATRGGFSYDDAERQNGVFTAALLDGLHGAAGTEQQGMITIGNLAAFVNTQVQAWVRHNRPQHVGRSLGISETFEPPEMRLLPLAISAEKQREEYTERRRKALGHLVALVGTGDSLFSEAAKTLSADKPSSEHFDLIAELEAFDGTPQLRRSLAGFLAENREALMRPLAKFVELDFRPSNGARLRWLERRVRELGNRIIKDKRETELINYLREASEGEGKIVEDEAWDLLLPQEQTEALVPYFHTLRTELIEMRRRAEEPTTMEKVNRWLESPLVKVTLVVGTLSETALLILHAFSSGSFLIPPDPDSDDPIFRSSHGLD